MFARKFSSLGSNRWPRPWRARKATFFPSSVPTTNASDGSPNGVFTLTSRVPVSPLMVYRPLPPIIPISASAAFVRARFPFAFPSFAMLFSWELPVQVHRFEFHFFPALVQRGRRHIRVMPEHHNPPFVGQPRHPVPLGFQCLQGIEVVGHDPRQGNMVTRRQQIRNKRELLPASS